MLSSSTECKRSRLPNARRLSPLERDPTSQTGKLAARRVFRLPIKKLRPTRSAILPNQSDTSKLETDNGPRQLF
jgi:hypothetical protein